MPGRAALPRSPESIIGATAVSADALRVLRQPKGQRLASSDLHPFETRVPTTREGTKLKAGALLVREWNGRLELR